MLGAVVQLPMERTPRLLGNRTPSRSVGAAGLPPVGRNKEGGGSRCWLRLDRGPLRQRSPWGLLRPWPRGRLRRSPEDWRKLGGRAVRRHPVQRAAPERWADRHKRGRFAGRHRLAGPPRQPRPPQGAAAAACGCPPRARCGFLARRAAAPVNGPAACLPVAPRLDHGPWLRGMCAPSGARVPEHRL